MKTYLLFIYLLLLFIPFYACQDKDKVDPIPEPNSKRLKSAIDYSNGLEDTKSIFFYENNKLSKVETYFFLSQKSEWIHVYDGIFSYNNNRVGYTMEPIADSLPVYFKIEHVIENETVVETTEFSKLTGAWEISKKFNWYIKNSRLDSLNRTNYNQGNAINMDKWIYQYDNNEIKQADFYLWYSDSWFLNFKYEYSFKADSMIIEGFHNHGDEYVISSRNKRIFQNSKIIQSLEYVLWGGDNWQFSSEENYIYNSEGLLKEYLYEDSTEEIKTIYEYEEGQGNLSWFVTYDELLLQNPFPTKTPNKPFRSIDPFKCFVKDN